MKFNVKTNSRRFAALLVLISVFAFRFAELNAQNRKPNILVIWGDDIGRSNISSYTMGMMGYQTPNIDRIAKEGIIFTTTTGSNPVPADDPPLSPGKVCFARDYPRQDSRVLSLA